MSVDLTQDGYWEHLNEEQTKILEQFLGTMKSLEEEDLKKNGNWPADSDPSELSDLDLSDMKLTDEQKQEIRKQQVNFKALRFLRARKFDTEKASEMYQNHLEWRRTHSIPTITTSGIPKKLELASKVVPFYRHGVDKQNRPVFVDKVGKTEAKTVMCLFRDEEYLKVHNWRQQQRVFACKEQTKKLMKEKLEKGESITNTNVETFTLIIDLSGISKQALQSKSFLSMCAKNDEANYPERVGHIFIINAPWFFSLFWKLLTPLMDARTKSKITVGGINELKQLIAEESIPKEYGGQCDCQGGCLPETDLSNVNLLSYLTSNGNQQADELKEMEVTAGKQVTITLQLSTDGLFHHPHMHANKASSPIHISAPPIEEQKQGGAIKQKLVGWYWRCLEGSDIKFKVTLTSKDQDIVVQEEIRSSVGQGFYEYPAVEDAVLTLTFDNSFSWFNGKKLRYSIIQTNNVNLDKQNDLGVNLQDLDDEKEAESEPDQE